jgi:phage recombination protein Bet
MTTSTELALPTDGDSTTWSEREKALVEAAGLVRVVDRTSGRKELADRPTVEAFLAHCRRTGLDPIARQIYAIYRAGKWGIQVSIDGARLVAERSGRYEGQTPTQWTDDGSTWVDVWLKDAPPRAARVGVYKKGFREPLYAVANWDSYAVVKEEWANGRKTGNVVVSDMWQKFGPLMLGKCAEMLALRKAFPQDLSGLYSTEEMAQVDGDVVPLTPAAPRDWKADIDAATTVEALSGVARAARDAGALETVLEGGLTVLEYGLDRKVALEDAEEAARGPAPLPGTSVSAPTPRDWVGEAEVLDTAAAVRELAREADALGADQKVLERLEAIAALKPAGVGGQADGEWPKPEGAPDDWNAAAVLADGAQPEPTSEPDPAAAKKPAAAKAKDPAPAPPADEEEPF